MTAPGYKHSKFTKVLADGDGYLVFNGMSGAILKLTLDEYQSYLSFADENSVLSSVLKSKGMWIEEDIDENYILFSRRCRTIFDSNQKQKITIAPTLDCNCHCYYCYEHGRPTVTMSDEVIDKVVDFISDNKKGDNVHISWFGGEPLMGSDVIDKIVDKLTQKGIKIESTMTTNGLLFTKELVERAKNVWNLFSVQVPIDGIGEYYGFAKRPNAGDYDSLLKIINLLLDAKISVSLRLNVSNSNIGSILSAIDDICRKIPDRKLLSAYCMPLFNPKHDGDPMYIGHEDLGNKCAPIIRKLESYGLSNTYATYLSFHSCSCEASLIGNYIIDPTGNIYKCPQLIGTGKGIIGTIYSGVKPTFELSSWCNPNVPDKCNDCKYLPICQGGCKMYDSYCLFDDEFYDVCIKTHVNKKQGILKIENKD